MSRGSNLRHLFNRLPDRDKGLLMMIGMLLAFSLVAGGALALVDALG
jgi:hypothetical protein